MIKLGVIGRDVSQSASPPIHKFIAAELGKEVSYERISIPESDFERKIDGMLSEYDGLNVTIPYKLGIIPHLTALEGDAATFGAVNTVNCNSLRGYNTDGLGFMMMLAANGVRTSGKSALVLGAGGAGRSAAKKLLDAGAQVDVYNRTYAKAEALQSEFGVRALSEPCDKYYDIIVNATGVGMHESEGKSPVPPQILSDCGTAVDLIYKPEKSEFLKIAEGLGKKIVNGFSMLFYQAYYADCVFFGIKEDEEQAIRLYKKYGEEISR